MRRQSSSLGSLWFGISLITVLLLVSAIGARHGASANRSGSITQGPINPITWTDYPYTTTPKLAFTQVGKASVEAGNFRFACPAGGTLGRVVGSGPYNGDDKFPSSICSAAVHAGLITTASGGVITIRLKQGVVNYPGSERNGVKSESYTKEHPTYDIAFEFIGSAVPPPPPPAGACGNYKIGSGINAKWVAAGGAKGRLGCPIMDEADAARSPNGTSGRYVEFNAGDGAYLIWHGGGRFASQTFDVNGCFFKIYKSQGGPRSWFGYPVGDAFETPTGSRQDFEGGYTVWDKQTQQCSSAAYGKPAASDYEWVSAGPGDCTGSDTGSSDGSAVPNAGACDASRVNTVAICWDGSTYRHPAKGGAWCTYKSKAANPCTRPGANYGQTYICRSKLTADYESAKKPFVWARVGVGDCAGNDVGQSLGSVVPALGECNTAMLGTLAVCWDGSTYSNPSRRGAWCTYKSRAASPCRGGSNPGFVYECRTG